MTVAIGNGTTVRIAVGQLTAGASANSFVSGTQTALTGWNFKKRGLK